MDKFEKELADMRARDEARMKKFLEDIDTADAFLKTMEPALASSRGTLIIAQGMYSPLPQEAERVFVIRVCRDTPAEAPEMLGWTWLPEAERTVLKETLKATHQMLVGECDAMARTDWTLVWAGDTPRSVALWSTQGCLLKTTGESVFLGKQNRTIPLSDVKAVRAFVSASWVTRSLELIVDHEDPIELAVEQDMMAKVDPTYDHIELFCSASWLRASTKALAKALKVPARIAPDLT